MTTVAAKRKKGEKAPAGSLWYRIKKNRMGYVFILPYVLLFLLFTILPVAISIIFSFTSFNVFQMPTFTGLDNYIALFTTDPYFIKAIKNTVIIAAITGPGGYILSFAFAWILNELPRGVRTVATVLLYAPTLSGNMYLIFTIFFSGDSYGYANSILYNLGLISEPIQWLRDSRFMLLILVVIILWTSLGTGFLAFVAGFQGIDRSLYEAAAVDGVRNRWQELWFVTLPMIRPQMLFGAVMSITSSFGVGTIVTAMAGFPSANYAAHTMINHLEDYGSMRYELGYACAIATILFVIMLVCNFAVRRLLSKVGT